MKNSLVKALAGIGLIAVVVFATMAFTAIEETKYSYCEIVGSAKAFSKKVTISVDFGNDSKLFADQKIRDEATGKAKSFNSMVDALNFMGGNGWELVQAYTVTTGGANTYHWMLKKKVQ